MRFMTADLDEASILNANDSCEPIPNEELFRPKHTVLPAAEPRP